ncbi:hypothetical protein Salmuc_02911 [Salipiger mucosus DSM 16094]|uniref:Uncharacterized protein n=2 Tax=Salipiger mucosus TaxID=263378 RepID=S9RQX7_9RHOB|nr:hypothetical protein Salmuc_02911 [Salipiger mucosus DSM 16094]
MESGVAFHFKQWGDWAPGDGENLPAEKVRRAQDGTSMVRVGKRNAGRTLDGCEWNQLPIAR